MADETTPAGPPPGPGADETQPVAEGATQVSPPAASPPTTPPPTTPPPTAPGGPTPPGGATGAKGTVPQPLFIVVAIVAVAALAFGIFSFLGKNSESDKKKDAESELTAAEDRAQAAENEAAKAERDLERSDQALADLQDQLGASEDFSSLIVDVLTQSTEAVNTLYTCTATAREFAINEIEGSSTVEQAQAVDDQCAASDQAYDDYFAAIEQLPTE